MSIQPHSNEPIDPISILKDAYEIKNELHYYEVTDKGLKEKNFFGRCFAWILNFVGLKTSLHVWIEATAKYMPLIPNEYEAFKSRFAQKDLCNLKNISAVKKLANAILSTTEKQTNTEIKTKAKIFKAFTEKVEADIKQQQQQSLKALTLEIPLPKDILEFKEPIEQFKAFLPEKARSDEYLLNQFNHDCHRRGFLIENADEHLDCQPEVIDHSYELFFDKNQGIETDELQKMYLQEVNILIRNWILEHHQDLKSIIEDPSSNTQAKSQAQETIDKISKEIKLFLNQIVSNTLFTNPDKYPAELQNKTVEWALSPASDVAQQEEIEGLPPLNFRCRDTTVLTSKDDTVTNASVFTIYEGYGGEPIAIIKGEASLDLKNKKLIIKPITEFEVTPNCLPDQLSRLTKRFLK